MNCRQFDERLDSFLDGDLAPAERAQLEAHAGGCAACRAALGGLRAAERALRAPEFQSAPPGMLAEFHRRLGAATARRPAWSFPTRWPWPALGAAAAAAAAVLVAFGPLRYHPGLTGTQTMARNEVPGAAGPSVSGGAGEQGSRGAREQGSNGAREPGSGGAREPGSKGAGEPGSGGARELGSGGGGIPAPVAERAAPPVSAPSGRPGPSLARVPAPPGSGGGRGPAAVVPVRREDQYSAPAGGQPLSSALLAALQRPVTLSVAAEPALRAAQKLGEEADVLVQVDARASGNAVSFQAHGVPLWRALEEVAQQSGLVIEPKGDGIALTQLTLKAAVAPRAEVMAERALPGNAAVAPGPAGPVEARRRESRAAPSEGLPTTPGAAGDRGAVRRASPPVGNVPTLAAGGAGTTRAAIWSAAWGELPAQGFGNTAQAYTQGFYGGQGFGGGGPGGPQAGQWTGGGGLGGFGGGIPSPGGMTHELGVGGASADEPAARNRGGRERAAPAAPKPESPMAAARPAATRGAGRPGRWVSVADGRVLLVRSADGTRYAALQPARQEAGRAPGVRYRVWVLDRDGRVVGPEDAAPRVLTARTSRGGGAQIRLESLPGGLEWTPLRRGEGRFRSPDGALQVCPTSERDVRNLNPPAPGRAYR
jgi:hypothetical protein